MVEGAEAEPSDDDEWEIEVAGEVGDEIRTVLLHFVTLSKAKGLAIVCRPNVPTIQRFFAALRMTTREDRDEEATGAFDEEWSVVGS